MANEAQLALLTKGVDAWNEWRKENPGVVPDLSGAELDYENLNHVDLSQAKLTSAYLRGANLNDANLNDADLSQAKLTSAYLRDTNLRYADLSYANLAFADLSRANFSGADFTNAIMGWTSFGDVDLSEVKGLETVRHEGPSTIGIDTIFRSKGNIPHKFLLDAGVPQGAIDYLLPPDGNAIDFYSCFISYSTKDQEFATRLHADLQVKGVRCWFAPEDIQGGKKIHEQIDQAIRVYDKLLLVLSEQSMGSEWVKTEIYTARQREMKEDRRMLFPISLVSFDAIRQWKAFDADTGKDMGREVREYFIPDFSHWKDHDSYQKAFDRLLRDLKAG